MNNSIPLQAAKEASAQSKTGRNPDGTFTRYYTKKWDGSEWNEGKLQNRGYFYVYRPDHPNRSPMGMVRRHHIVWWLETGEVIQPGEALHHIDGDKTNDKLDNLQKMSHGDHTRLHSSKPEIECTCNICGDIFYTPQFRINQGRGKVCSQECWQSFKRGANSSRAKLSKEQVDIIRSSTQKGADLARRFGVAPGIVSNVRTGRTYV